MNEICVSSFEIPRALCLRLIERFEKKESTEGPAWYVDDYDNAELLHAKLYSMGDCYNIPGLCELALQRLGAHMTTTYDAKVNRDSVDYLMENTSHEDKRVRMEMARLLSTDLEQFGILSHAKDLLDKYPVLKDYLLHGIFHDDVAKGRCWDRIAQSIQPPEYVKKVEATDANEQEDDQVSHGREAYVQIGGTEGA